MSWLLAANSKFQGAMVTVYPTDILLRTLIIRKVVGVITVPLYPGGEGYDIVVTKILSEIICCNMCYLSHGTWFIASSLV